MGAAIDAGGVALSMKDSYCRGHTCRDLSASQSVSAGQIISSIPTGPMADVDLCSDGRRVLFSCILTMMSQLNKFSAAIGALQPWSVFRHRVS
jgi:hypothetical protein